MPELTLLNVTWDVTDTPGQAPPAHIFVPADLEAQLLKAVFPDVPEEFRGMPQHEPELLVADWLSDKYGWCVEHWEYN